MNEPQRSEMIVGQPAGGGMKIIILHTVEPGQHPDFPTVAKVSCGSSLHCGEWLWVSAKVLPILRTGDTIPVCQPCGAMLTAQPGSLMLGMIHQDEDEDE